MSSLRISASSLGLGCFLLACSGPSGSGREHGGSAGGSGPSTGGSAGSLGVGGSVATGGSQTSAGGGSVGGSSTGGSAGQGTGGSGATGGDETGGTGPIVVTDCGELPEPGTWEKISPPEFLDPSNMETLAVVVGIQDQRVYAAAGNKTNGGNEGTGILESTDCGSTWTVKTTGTNSDKLLTGDPWAVMIDPRDPEVLYMNNGYGADPTLYKSTNGGVDFTQLSTHPTEGVTMHVQAIAMDPNDPDHIAVTYHGNCESPYNALCLSYSTDAGDNWTLFNGPASLAGWQEAATLSIFGPGQYVFVAGTAWYTDDTGESWTKVAEGGLFGSYAGGMAIAPDGTVYMGGNNVYKSNDNGATWDVIPGSPKSSVLIHDGDTLFSSHPYGGEMPVWFADLDDTTSWTNMQQNTGRGANQLAYDSVHHILYAANWQPGLWRLVTK
jgi:hypothetical protein